MKLNNFDTSSTGTSIEFVGFHDLSRFYSLSEENFESLGEVNRIPYYHYHNYETFKNPLESVKFTLVGDMKEVKRYAKDYKLDWRFTGINTDQELRELVLQEICDGCNALEVLAGSYNAEIYNLCVVHPENIKKIYVTGYSQGDQAIVVVDVQKIREVFGVADLVDDEKFIRELKEEFEHLFFDAPIYACFKINGEEYCYYDSPAYSDYEWNRENFVEWVANESGVPFETLIEYAPEYLDHE